MGDLFIVDSENSRIVKLNGFSQIERTFGGLGAGRGRLEKPTRVEIGPNDNVYVVDGKRVVVFDGFGNYLRDLIEEAFSGNILLAGDELGVVVLSGDSMYVFDEENRLWASLSLTTLMNGEHKGIRAMALSRGTLYLLASDGLVTVPNPRH
jgi:hypothetical protein